MDIDQIRAFVAITRLRSFTRAARTLHRSQPAISRRIDFLEDELGSALFDRIGNRITLTDAGAALLPYAEALLAAAKDGVDAVRSLRDGDNGSLSIALVGTLADDAFTEILRRFTKRHPNVQIDIQTANSWEVGNIVRRGEAMIGLRYLVDSSHELVCRTVKQEAMVVVSGKAHPLAKRRIVDLQQLAGERWVAFRTGATPESSTQFLTRKLAAVGLDRPDIIPIDSLTAQKRLVEANFGIALLAKSGVLDELKRGSLKVLRAPALRASIPVTVVHRKNGYLSASAQNFISALLDGG